jgi:hypothetical protein
VTLIGLELETSLSQSMWSTLRTDSSPQERKQEQFSLKMNFLRKKLRAFVALSDI